MSDDPFRIRMHGNKNTVFEEIGDRWVFFKSLLTFAIVALFMDSVKFQNAMLDVNEHLVDNKVRMALEQAGYVIEEKSSR